MYLREEALKEDYQRTIKIQWKESVLDSVIGGFLLNTMQETQAVPMVATSCPPNANQLNVVRVDQTKPGARGIRHVVEICGRSRIHAADYQIITLRNILTTENSSPRPCCF